MSLILFFVFGLCVGSFLNVVICRLKTKENLLFVRSHCAYCKKTLAWYELIPVLSFLIQKGKCRHCKQEISIQYILVELATAILFVVFAFDWLNLFFASILIVVFVYDLKHYLIPDQIIYLGLLASVIFNWQNYLGLLAAAGFFLILVFVSKETWMGWGDVKLAGLMGLILGWPNVLYALCFAFVSGAIIGLCLILAKRKTIKSQMPFGPFLVSATIIVLLLIKYYV